MEKNNARYRADVEYDEVSGHEGSDARYDPEDAYVFQASFDMVAEVSQS
jgi:hypothetical protein